MEISLKEYARHRGESPRAVRKAIESGRLTAASCRRGRNRWFIDPSRADLEWEDATNPARQRPRERRRGGPADYGQAGLFGDLDPPPGPQPAPVEGNGNGVRLARAQALRTTFQAQRERLKFEQESGQLVRREEVEVEAFQLARQLRDRLNQIPARVRDEFAAETSAIAIEERLQAEIHTVLRELIS